MDKFSVKFRTDSIDNQFATQNDDRNSNNNIQTANKEQQQVSFLLDFFAENKFVSSIRKSIDEVKQFSLELTSASQLLPLVNVKIPQFTHQDNSLDTTLIGQEVESFVNDLLKIDNEDFWKLGSIHKFLEYVESDTVSNMTELRLHVLTDQLSTLQSTVQRWEEKIKNTEEKIISLKQWIQSNPQNFAVENAALSARFSDTTDDTSRAEDSIDASGQKFHRPELPHQTSTKSNASLSSIPEEANTAENGSEDRTVSSQPTNKNLQQLPAEHDPELLSSTFLPPSLVRLILDNTTFEAAIEEILDFLSQPHEQSHQQQLAYLTQQLQPYLPNKFYDIGMHSIGYSLVDDEIKLLVLEDRVSSDSLEKVAFQAFRTIATTTTVSKRQKESSVLDSRAHDNNGEYSFAFNPQQQKPGQLIATVNQLPLIVHFQNTTDVALLLLFDEVNQLVGKNNLFQKSVHLIRAWWIYESILYVGATIKHYLPNNAFLIMICAIFNKYHHLIETPFQALCIFLHEYSCYLPTTHAISIEGFVDVKQSILPDEANSATSSSKDSTNGNGRPLLIDQQLISKYQVMSDHPSQHVDLLEITNGVYIVHPLNGSNMVVDKLTANQVIRLTKALQNGANNLAVFIRQLQDKTVSNPAQLIKNYFPNIILAVSNSSSLPSAGNNMMINRTFDLRIIDTNTSRSRENIRKNLIECINYARLISKGEIHLDAVHCMMRSITKDFLNQGMHLSDILAEMMHRVSSVAREQLIQSSSDILLSLVQIVREEVDSVDKAEGEDSLVVLEDHDIDPVIMLRGRPRPPASFGLIHPNDTLSMNMGSQYMDSMMGRERLGSGGGQNEIMGNKNSPQQMHHKQMKGSQNMHHGNNNYHHNHHNQGGRLHGPGNHSNFGRGGMSGGNYSQQGSYYPSSHGPQHNSYQNQQHNAPNYYNNSPQGHGGVYHNNRPNSFGANHSSNNGMKLVPNSFPRPHVGGNTGVNMGNNQDYPGNILPPSAYYARNKTFSSTTTTSVGNFRNVNNNHGNSNAFHSGGQDSLSGLGGLSNNDSFGLQSQRGGGYNNQNNGLRGGGGNFQQHGIFDMSSSSLGSSILPPSNPLGFRSTTTSTLSTNSSNTSLSSNHDPAIRRQDLWFDGF